MSFGSLASVTCPTLDHESVAHAFFTRQGGVSQGVYASLNGGWGSNDQPQAIKTNRTRMAEHLGITTDHLLSLYQIHSPTCITVTAPWSVETRPHADAMVTNRPGLALAIGTADCGPLLFVDKRARVIGAAHAGWKGALYGVIEATIKGMTDLGADPSTLDVALGPTISQSAYEVGPEFHETFLKEDASSADCFSSPDRSGKTRFNLPNYIEKRVKRFGVTSFTNLDLCTYRDDERFYSYRRTTHRQEADYGRLISAILLKT